MAGQHGCPRVQHKLRYLMEHMQVLSVGSKLAAAAAAAAAHWGGMQVLQAKRELAAAAATRWGGMQVLLTDSQRSAALRSGTEDLIVRHAGGGAVSSVYVCMHEFAGVRACKGTCVCAVVCSCTTRSKWVA